MDLNHKCIVFELPSGSGGMAAALVGSRIINRIKSFCDNHGIKFMTKRTYYKLKIWFEREEDYTIFFLIYDFNEDWRKPTLIDEEYT